MLILGDTREAVIALAPSSFDAIITDPPYEIKFMGREWDNTGVAFDPKAWASVLRVLKPGGYMACFGGNRTFHRMACAIEDAGFQMRDCLMWIYGTGMPKGKACLKPAWEPILLARKAGKGVLPFNVDECRSAGRWPANVLHDGSDEVLETFATFGETSKSSGGGMKRDGQNNYVYGKHSGHQKVKNVGFGDTGSAARFFYCAKASRTERGAGNTHPTVKPIALMRWLVRLLTPVRGDILDPFAGSGTTVLAAHMEGRSCVGIENDEESYRIACQRTGWNSEPEPI